MPQEFKEIFQYSLTLEEAFTNLGIAFICGLIISYFYRKSYNGGGYTKSFVNSLIVLAMITAVVIMVIGNNLARAFGLVGAMSIIRFRTAVKETLDIIFIFFALSIGMAAGVGFHQLAILATITIGGVLVILSRTNLISPIKKEQLLQFNFNTKSPVSEKEYIKIINSYASKYKLINAKSLGDTDLIEISYFIQLRKEKIEEGLITELKNLEGVSGINIFFDEEYF
ncbi:MAG: DUF4956 domain-containing protein [Melioribacteraceae bacterium]|nr:DUF4956 domain-containing protein [Melioribacteraceae bacterium]MCF8264597.1 DUF4956 domain-containing protein [Melioribacteraceae bacterium]